MLCRQELQADARPVTAQDREGLGSEAEEAEKGGKEGMQYILPFWINSCVPYLYFSTEPRMAVKDQEGPRYSQPLSF